MRERIDLIQLAVIALFMFVAIFGASYGDNMRSLEAREFSNRLNSRFFFIIIASTILTAAAQILGYLAPLARHLDTKDSMVMIFILAFLTVPLGAWYVLAALTSRWWHNR